MNISEVISNKRHQRMSDHCPWEKDHYVFYTRKDKWNDGDGKIENVYICPNDNHNSCGECRYTPSNQWFKLEKWQYKHLHL